MSRLEGKITADVVGFKAVHNPDNDARIAYVSYRVRGDRPRIARIFGEELAKVAFGAFVRHMGEGEDGTYEWGYKRIVPDAIFEQHNVKLGERELTNVQPEILGVSPVDDMDQVDVTLRLPVSIGDNTTLAGELVTSLGDVVELEFTPKQMELPLSGGGNGATITRGAFGNPKPVEAGA